MLKRAGILTNQLFSWKDPDKLAIGGGEKVCLQLAQLLLELDYEVHIWQYSPLRFNRVLDGIQIHGISNLQTTHGVFLSGLGDYFHDVTKHFDRVIICLPDVVGAKVRGDAILLTQGIMWGMKSISELLDIEKEYLRKVWSRVGTNVVVHQFTTDTIRGLGFGEIADKIVCIGNCVDTGVFKPAIKEKTLIFPARCEKAKGTNFMPEILERLSIPDWQIKWVGGGSQFDELKKLEDKHDNFSVVSVPMDDMASVYATAAISVCFNLSSRGNSLTLMESMASSCSCIGIRGNTTLIDDGINGLLCSTSAKEISDNINMLATDPGLYSDIGTQARYDMIDNHSVDVWKERWAEIIK